ncbi:hypothetical protein VNO78_05751 [Psophocarpus tetragonolobus]|uniref:Uncharacterized protein n=1 Tax=Psophocarpus tetragonolobus TaxID=3891 RepID=A0AAN9SSV0_PSOTE
MVPYGRFIAVRATRYNNGVSDRWVKQINPCGVILKVDEVKKDVNEAESWGSGSDKEGGFIIWHLGPEVQAQNLAPYVSVIGGSPTLGLLKEKGPCAQSPSDMLLLHVRVKELGHRDCGGEASRVQRDQSWNFGEDCLVIQLKSDNLPSSLGAIVDGLGENVRSPSLGDVRLLCSVPPVSKQTEEVAGSVVPEQTEEVVGSGVDWSLVGSVCVQDQCLGAASRAMVLAVAIRVPNHVGL